MKKKQKKSAKGTPKEISKIQKVRDVFKERKSWTLEEIVERSGFDERNVKTCLSILRNPKRSKEFLITHLDREKKLYTMK
jgi:transposase